MSVSTIWSPFPQARELKPVLGNLVAWFDADDASTITKDGSDYVSEWADKSGYGNNAHATGSARPLWVDDQANSRSVIRFDGSSDWLNAGSDSSLDSDELTLQIVLKEGVNSSWTCMIRKCEYNQWNHGWNITASNPLSAYTFVINQYGDYDVSISSPSKSTYSLLTCIYDKSLGSSNIRAWLNGVHQGSYNYTSDIDGDAYELHIGGDNNNYEWAGDFSEILIYNRPLSSSEISRNEVYLNQKWGL